MAVVLTDAITGAYTKAQMAAVPILSDNTIIGKSASGNNQKIDKLKFGLNWPFETFSRFLLDLCYLAFINGLSNPNQTWAL